MSSSASGSSTSTALLTDHYELTMLASALRDGTAERECVFEVFARRLPAGRRYGVVAGTQRILDAIADFRFTNAELAQLEQTAVVDSATLDWLADYRFTGDIDGYPEGELYFPGSPVLTVRGTFAESVLLETLVLSILNYDSAVDCVAARMSAAANGRPIIEMGGRRAHEYAAVAAARAAYLAGFATTSNLEAGRRYGIPTRGTVAHAFILLHDNERSAFAARSRRWAPTPLLVDTYDITRGIETAARRGRSSAPSHTTRRPRCLARQPGSNSTLGAKDPIVVSGDLDEHAIAALRAEPVDAYGVGTSVVTGSGAPTAGMVYKLVEVNGRPVAKRSEHKASRGGRKAALRRHKPTGTALEEIVYPVNNPPEPEEHDKQLQFR